MTELNTSHYDSSELVPPHGADIWETQAAYDGNHEIDLAPDSLDEVLAGGADSFGLYLTEIGRVPLLEGRPEEIEVAKRIEAGLHAARLIELAQVEDLDAAIGNLREELISKTVPRFKPLQPLDDMLEDLGKSARKIRELPSGEQGDMLADLREVEQDGIAARNQFWAANLRLVVKYAKRKQNKGLTLQELVQAGNINGLLRAVQKFDYTHGEKFSTYATNWILQSLDRAIANTARSIRVSMPQRERINKMKRIQRDEMQILGRELTDAELAERLEVTVAKIIELKQLDKELTSLNKTSEVTDSDTELGDLVDIDEKYVNVQAATNEVAMRTDVMKMVGLLPQEQAALAVLRYGLNGRRPHTLKEAADELGISVDKVKHLDTKTNFNLRELADSLGLRDYLAD
ncbi:MAG TPA: sigma-70 family RNA polymerase sigma factor [Candidatus Saccharimonadales bacterium]|nr:sigma-70 family RNA polymerase sigma factor [Candidatus Saccharimonadales bacterium]